MDPDLTTARGVAARRDEVQLVDVRERREWDRGHIPGSVHIPLQALMAGRAEGIEPGKPVVTVCHSGARSEVAALMLKARGLEAHNLEGGVVAWNAEGLDLVTPDGSPGRPE